MDFLFDSVFISSLQIGGIKTFCPTGHILLWRYSDILDSKNQTKKIAKTHKDFELYQIFMYNFQCQTVLIFPIYILFIKIIEAFWSRDVTSTRGIRKFLAQNL